MRDDRYVVFLDGGTTPRTELLGGKCASLVTMAQAGVPVPPGFVVTTAAYDAVIDESGVADQIRTALLGLDGRDPSAVDTASQRIRSQVLSSVVPDGVREQVLQAFDALRSRSSEEVPVAVRSSGTAEDLPGASFAGQHESYLWVRGADAVLEQVQRCWASLHTSRAIHYRLRHGISSEALSMAVAVQNMANARISGVAMTVDPVSGDDTRIVVNASYGVGELVVSGHVTPDHVVLDKATLRVVSELVGDKHAELVPDVDLGRLVERDVSDERRGRLCITGRELTAVASMAMRVEALYGTPQDVEWAFDVDLPPGEDLLVLQSRPETAHTSSRASPPTGTPGRRSWTGP